MTEIVNLLRQPEGLLENLRVLWKNKTDNSETAYGHWFKEGIAGEGCDISKFDNPHIMDWKLYWSKATIAIFRGLYKVTPDPYFESVYKPQIKSELTKMKVKGLYQYMSTEISVQQQIGEIQRQLDMFEVGELQQQWIDIEAFYNDRSSSAYRDNPPIMMEAINRSHPHIAVGFYTNMDNFSNWLNSPKWWMYEGWLFWYAYWIWDYAQYPTPPAGVQVEDVYMWQDTGEGAGNNSQWGGKSNSGSIDHNLTRDSYEELKSDYGLGEMPVPIPEPSLPEDCPDCSDAYESGNKDGYNNAMLDVSDYAEAQIK